MATCRENLAETQYRYTRYEKPTSPNEVSAYSNTASDQRLTVINQMSTNRLGRARNLDQFWRQSHLSSSEAQVELEIPERPSHVDSFADVPEYPFEGQDRYRGWFKFRFRDWQGKERTEEGEYEYRDESRLFILSPKSERVPAKDILQAINEQLDNTAKIQDSISVKRKPLWDFFGNADQYDSLVLTGPKGRFDFTTLKHVAHRLDADELANLKTLSEAEVQNRVKEPEKVKAVIPLLDDINLSSEIRSLDDLGIDPSRYLIERGEVKFEYQDELVSITYDRGDLSFNDEVSEDGREYVVQLFERDVVYPSYGR